MPLKKITKSGIVRVSPTDEEELARQKEQAEIEAGLDVETVSARRGAESAITEFQKASDTLSLEEARKAYARLMIGRGFDRAKRAAAEPPARAEVKPADDTSATPSEPEGTSEKGP